MWLDRIVILSQVSLLHTHSAGGHDRCAHNEGITIVHMRSVHVMKILHFFYILLACLVVFNTGCGRCRVAHINIGYAEPGDILPCRNDSYMKIAIL